MRAKKALALGGGAARNDEQAGPEQSPARLHWQ